MPEPSRGVPPPATRASFGIDAPGVAVGLATATILGAAPLLVPSLRRRRGAGFVAGSVSVPFGATLAVYLYGTLRGKFLLWDDELDRLALRGDETVVDLGCGRGAVLLAAAQRVREGRAIGVDLWRSVDQSGNDVRRTRSNAAALGLSDVVELHTADIRRVPLPDGCADVVLTSLVVHNLPDADARSDALREAVRLLRPGGRLVLLDIAHVPEYAEVLAREGLHDVVHRNAGRRYVVPPTGSRVLTARR